MHALNTRLSKVRTRFETHMFSNAQAVVSTIAAVSVPLLCFCEIVSCFMQVIYPSKDPKVKKYHDAKYRIFRELYEQQMSHRSIMAQALS